MSSFEPTGFFAGPHLQTISAVLPRGLPPHDFVRAGKPFVHPVPGGAVTGTMHWNAAAHAPLVILVHGLGGSADSGYLLQNAHALWQRGAHVLRFNLAGAGSSAAVAPYLFHAGLTTQLDAVVRAFAATPSIEHVSIVGFSLGGNVVLSLAAEWADAPPANVRAVASLAAPLDLAASSRHLERWQSAVYRHHVLRALVAQASRFRRAQPDRADYKLRELWPLTSLRAYDRLVVVPHYGFAGVDDYYAKASAGPRLGQITVPTLLLHATDDPMVPGADIRAALTGASSAIEARFTDRGGHLGWAEGLGAPALANRWSTRTLVSWLQERAES